MLADIVDVADYVVVPEAQDGPAILFQTQVLTSSPATASPCACWEPSAFDDEFLLRASEIDNVTGNRKLSPEAKPHQPVRAKFVPELQFS